MTRAVALKSESLKLKKRGQPSLKMGASMTRKIRWIPFLKSQSLNRFKRFITRHASENLGAPSRSKTLSMRNVARFS